MSRSDDSFALIVIFVQFSGPTHADFSFKLNEITENEILRNKFAFGSKYEQERPSSRIFAIDFLKQVS